MRGVSSISLIVSLSRDFSAKVCCWLEKSGAGDKTCRDLISSRSDLDDLGVSEPCDERSLKGESFVGEIERARSIC